MMKNVWRLILSGFFALLSQQNVMAELQPVFSMDFMVSEAAVICEGCFDEKGLFVVSNIIKGAKEPHAKLLKVDLKGYSERFDEVMREDKASSFIVFLANSEADERAGLVHGFAGMVAISKSDKVYASLEAMNWGGSAVQAHGTWTKSSFLSELSQARRLSGHLTAILEMPRGSQRRTEAILDFAVANGRHVPSTEFHSHFLGKGYGFFFNKATQSMIKPSEIEESMIRSRLAKAPNDDERELLIAFAGRTQCSPGMFAVLLPYVAPGTQSAVRKEAIQALASVNPFEAAGVLSDFLEVDEPQLDTVIRSLCNCEWPRRHLVLNPKVLKPLRNLGKATLRSLIEGKTHDTNASNAVLDAMQQYFHPSFLPLLITWSESKETNTSGQAMSNLRSVLGISQYAMDEEKNRVWWRQEKALLEKEYDLENPSGIALWLDAWHGTSSPRTKNVLLRLWDFQPSIPETLLLGWCESPRSLASKELLSELWQRQRLTVETRKEIVRRYVKMKIIMEQSFYAKEPAPGEVKISGNRLFPFPEGASVFATGEVSGKYPPRIEDPKSGSGIILHGSGPRAFYTSSGTGDRSVKGVLEVWEMDYRASPSKELWRLRWKLSQTFGEEAKEVSALKE